MDEKQEVTISFISYEVDNKDCPRNALLILNQLLGLTDMIDYTRRLTQSLSIGIIKLARSTLRYESLPNDLPIIKDGRNMGYIFSWTLDVPIPFFAILASGCLNLWSIAPRRKIFSQEIFPVK